MPDTTTPAGAVGHDGGRCGSHDLKSGNRELITDPVTARQADRIARLYAVSYVAAVTVARLAYGVAR